MASDLLSPDEAALARRSTPELVEALDSTDPEVRACAIYALGGRPEAVTALAPCLADPSQFIARTAADALQRTGKAAVPALIDCLKNSSAQVRGLAARALADIKDTASIPALFNALEDESAFVQYWVDEALERMGVGQVYFKP
jgi:HEAT repeat protein